MISPETDLELAARSLEGESISRVVYVDAWDAPATPATIGIAVYLVLADRIVEVRWADELGLRHGFGIALRDVRVVDTDRGRATDATAAWTRAPIAASTIRWRAIDDDIRSSFRIGIAVCADHLGRIDYPHALDLAFADGRRAAIETTFTNHLTVRC